MYYTHLCSNQDICFLNSYQIPSLNIAEPGIHDEMYQLAKNLIKEFDADEIRKMGAAQGSRLPANRGTVLVFLPGKYFIYDCYCCYGAKG